MGAINFYLKKPEPKTNRSLIYLQYKYNGYKLTFSFGQTIDPKDWNPKKQRVKSTNQTTADGQYFLNDVLTSLEEACKKAYNLELKNGVPSPATMKRHLSNYIYQNEVDDNRPTFHKLLERYIKGEIKHKGKEKSPNTIKTYNTLKGHLIAFEQVKKRTIDYHTLDLNFLYEYITFLRTKFTEHDLKKVQDEKVHKTLSSLPIGQNAIAKDVQILKTVMKKGVTLGETKNVWHEHEDFRADREETDAVYLTEQEIIKLFKYNFSDRKRLEQVRDLFVFGCCVGLRFSDYSNIKPDNITTYDGEYFIKLITQKTGDLVIIPCNPIVLEIFDKYADSPNRLPKSISNQKFNDFIKEVCQEAGLTEKGRLATEPGQELWKCVSSHTARRSFATNLYLDGFPVIDLMKITGHKTEKAFMRYIRHSKLDAAKRLNTHIKKMWGLKLLKVAI